MIITSQGFGHFKNGMNNQDFGIETPRMLLILDGCSGCKYPEVGTRLFSQLFSRKEEYDSAEKFEDNVKKVFDELIDNMKSLYSTQEELENEFIMDNLLFTIIGCFDTENEYIVKSFGDGYIITQNNRTNVSYLRLSYGKYPPYFAYKYCSVRPGFDYTNYQFKTFRFDKKVFPNVCIATDGILPIVKGTVDGIDSFIVTGNDAFVETSIRNNIQKFNDDVTIGMFTNKLNGGMIYEVFE